MKKTMLWILAAALIFLWLLLLLEGGFHISTAGIGELDKLVPGDIPAQLPSAFSNTEKEDVAVSVYRDAGDEKTFYILEFSKNLLFDKYALAEVHKCDEPLRAFRTVASSPLHHYAYEVDLVEGTIEIYEGSRNRNLTSSLLSLTLCLLGIGFSAWKGKGA